MKYGLIVIGALAALGCSATLGGKTKDLVHTGTDVLEAICKVPPTAIDTFVDATVDAATRD